MIPLKYIFDKDKIYNYYYKNDIKYRITQKSLYILPIFFNGEKVYMYNQNFFYQNWNEILKRRIRL